jgi:hypothetical protein
MSNYKRSLTPTRTQSFQVYIFGCVIMPSSDPLFIFFGNKTYYRTKVLKGIILCIAYKNCTVKRLLKPKLLRREGNSFHLNGFYLWTCLICECVLGGGGEKHTGQPSRCLKQYIKRICNLSENNKIRSKFAHLLLQNGDAFGMKTVQYA